MGFKFWIRREFLILAAGLALVVCLGALGGDGRKYSRDLQASAQSAEKPVPVLGVRVLKTYPHDPHAFTQGLEYFDGVLYESTGETGQSSVRKVDLESGKVLQKTDLGAEYFGEGLTIFRGRIY